MLLEYYYNINVPAQYKFQQNNTFENKSSQKMTIYKLA